MRKGQGKSGDWNFKWGVLKTSVMFDTLGDSKTKLMASNRKRLGRCRGSSQAERVLGSPGGGAGDRRRALEDAVRTRHSGAWEAAEQLLAQCRPTKCAYCWPRGWHEKWSSQNLVAGGV